MSWDAVHVHCETTTHSSSNLEDQQQLVQMQPAGHDDYAAALETRIIMSTESGWEEEEEIDFR